MLIVTEQGEKILFDRLDDLRGHVDDNILEALKEFINDKYIDNEISESSKKRMSGLEEEIDNYNELINGVIDDINSISDDIEEKSYKSAISNLNTLREQLEGWL